MLRKYSGHYSKTKVALALILKHSIHVDIHVFKIIDLLIIDFSDWLTNLLLPELQKEERGNIKCFLYVKLIRFKKKHVNYGALHVKCILDTLTY